MTLFLHELRRARLALIVWTVAVGFMLGVSILIYPEMSSQMNEIGDMFSQMGSFSEAFGMDQVNLVRAENLRGKTQFPGYPLGFLRAILGVA